MIVAAAVCPMTPLLFRHLGGLTDPVAELREACVRAVRDLVSGADRVVVLGPSGVPGAPASWTSPGRPERPRAPELSLQVGAHLLELAGADLPQELVPIGPSDDVGAVAAQLRGSGPATRTALLVLADGSARRGQAAPGFIDDRAFGFDDHLASLLEKGDAEGLADLDAELADDLLVAGRPAFQVLGEALRGTPVDAALRFRDDPFGLTYLVSLWTLREAESGDSDRAPGA